MDLNSLYHRMLAKLLPRGPAWRGKNEAGTVLYLLIDGIKEEFLRIHQRALRLLEESDPRTTAELLPEWEKDLGLPGQGQSLAPTFEGRRKQVVAKETARGGQSIPFFVALALKLGYVVTINNQRPFRTGASVTGDFLAASCVWVVHAPLRTVVTFRTGFSCTGESLGGYRGNSILEAEFRKRKPSHSNVRFVYT